MRIFLVVLVLALAAAGGYGYYLNPTACQKLGNDVVADTKAIYLPALGAAPSATTATNTATTAPASAVQFPVGYVASANNPAPAAPVETAPAAETPAPVTTEAPLATAPARLAVRLPEFENADYDSAIAAAKEHNVPLLILFTGSDWCPYCQKLEQEVLGDDQFKNYVASHYVFLTVDDLRNSTVMDDDRTRIRDLETKFSVNGFPTLMIVDSNGSKVGEKSGYAPGSGPGAVINSLNSIAQK